MKNSKNSDNQIKKLTGCQLELSQNIESHYQDGHIEFIQRCGGHKYSIEAKIKIYKIDVTV